MCGIAGIISPHPLEGVLARMVRAMRHRGPDDHGTIEICAGERSVSLASTRLAILDLTPAGHMPMLDPASGNSIVFNGEIYNFRDIRRELESEGERFTSGTDTEVVLKGYRRWREGVVERLQGMFAFAVWDQGRQELFLARDRLGEKPLYYHQGPRGSFLFGSEVRALLASEQIERRLNSEARDIYLFNGFLVSPITAANAVRSLLPAHWIRVSSDGRILENARYWTPTARPASDGLDPTSGLARQMERAVRMRLISDVPLGAFLSGGLDSSTIVAMMARLGQKVRTVSVAFDEADHDESAYALWVARRFATDHTEVRLRREDFAGWFPDALDAMDQPSFDGVNTYCVARAAKQAGLTVALSGLGADELFGGYPFFRTLPWIRRFLWAAESLRPIPGWLASNWGRRGRYRVTAPWKLLEGLLSEGRNPFPAGSAMLASYQVAQSLFPWYVRQRILRPESCHGVAVSLLGLPLEYIHFLESELEHAGDDNPISTLALRLFLGERCLRDTDAMSMAVSLEVRTAFTDHGFVETALGIDKERRCRRVPDKRFQWDAFRPYLGPDYPLHGKQGFIFPLEEWLRDKRTLENLQEVLMNRRLLADIGIDPEGVKHLLLAFLRGRPRIPWSRVWAVFVFARWCEQNRVFL